MMGNQWSDRFGNTTVFIKKMVAYQVPFLQLTYFVPADD